MAFDGAKSFANLTILFLVSVLIASPYTGCGGWISALVALYYLLAYFNRLEFRDRNEHLFRRRHHERRR